MSVNTKMQGDTLTAYLSGEIDHHCAGVLRDAVDEAVLRNKPKVLCLDFAQVSFMDSSGIGLVMGRYRTVSACGGSLRLVNLSERELKIMRMSGIQKIAVVEGGESCAKRG